MNRLSLSDTFDLVWNNSFRNKNVAYALLVSIYTESNSNHNNGFYTPEGNGFRDRAF